MAASWPLPWSAPPPVPLGARAAAAPTARWRVEREEGTGCILLCCLHLCERGREEVLRLDAPLNTFTLVRTRERGRRVTPLATPPAPALGSAMESTAASSVHTSPSAAVPAPSAKLRATQRDGVPTQQLPRQRSAPSCSTVDGRAARRPPSRPAAGAVPFPSHRNARSGAEAGGERGEAGAADGANVAGEDMIVEGVDRSGEASDEAHVEEAEGHSGDAEGTADLSGEEVMRRLLEGTKWVWLASTREAWRGHAAKAVAPQALCEFQLLPPDGSGPDGGTANGAGRPRGRLRLRWRDTTRNTKLAYGAYSWWQLRPITPSEAVAATAVGGSPLQTNESAAGAEPARGVSRGAAAIAAAEREREDAGSWILECWQLAEVHKIETLQLGRSLSSFRSVDSRARGARRSKLHGLWPPAADAPLPILVRTEGCGGLEAALASDAAAAHASLCGSIWRWLPEGFIAEVSEGSGEAGGEGGGEVTMRADGVLLTSWGGTSRWRVQIGAADRQPMVITDTHVLYLDDSLGSFACSGKGERGVRLREREATAAASEAELRRRQQVEEDAASHATRVTASAKALLFETRVDAAFDDCLTPSASGHSRRELSDHQMAAAVACSRLS